MFQDLYGTNLLNSVKSEQHGVPISHAARQVKPADFQKFTHILAADESNLRNLERIRPRNSSAEVKLWGSYLDDKPIADPYYGGMVSRDLSCRSQEEFQNKQLLPQNGFESVYVQCQALSNAFLDSVVGKQEASASNL